METKQIRVGTKVKWTSQANGGRTTKAGMVVAIVPAGDPVYSVLARDVCASKEALVAGYNTQAIDVRTGPRNITSYVVEVAPKSPKGKPKLYWPLPRKLTRV